MSSFGAGRASTRSRPAPCRQTTLVTRPATRQASPNFTATSRSGSRTSTATTSPQTPTRHSLVSWSCHRSITSPTTGRISSFERSWKYEKCIHTYIHKILMQSNFQAQTKQKCRCAKRNSASDVWNCVIFFVKKCKIMHTNYVGLRHPAIILFAGTDWCFQLTDDNCLLTSEFKEYVRLQILTVKWLVIN